MEIWRIQTKNKPTKIFLDKSIAGLGWSLEEVEASRREGIKTYEDYKALAKIKYKSFDSVKRLANDVQKDDIIWMRADGLYYYARVGESSKWSFCPEKEFAENDIANQLSNIQWICAGDESSVPGAITTAFIKGHALQRIQKKE